MSNSILKNTLRLLGRMTPNIRFLRAFPNLVLGPLHNKLGLGGGVTSVLGFSMKLDPSECVDAGLWFAPHLYDAKEISFLQKRYRGGVFLDIGANIGFWSIYFAHRFPDALVYAIEANPNTFKILEDNIRLNGLSNVRAFNIGVAGCSGEMSLYLNETGNRGGDSLKPMTGNRRAISVPVLSLQSFLEENVSPPIELMKMDIEGMEHEALESIFKSSDDRFFPQYICAEISHSLELVTLLREQGYHILSSGRENCVFGRANDH
jgi:FkbM family methyltransferase